MIEYRERLINKAIPIKDRLLQGIILGLEEVANLLSRESWIDELYLQQNLTKDDDLYFQLSYYRAEPQDFKDREDYIASAKEEYVSPRRQSWIRSYDNFHVLEICNSEVDIDDLDNISMLLNSVATNLKKFDKDTKVLDLIYHDYINDDALHEPYIRVYLEGKLTP